ncbi:MAG TPA: hypothetical protein VIK48_05000, partial [Candidatus Manganitrophaceae bacterium]
MRAGVGFLWVSILFLQIESAFAQPFLELNAAGQAPGPTGEIPPRFHFTPSLDLALEYDDNILLRSVRRESDFIFRARPGFEMAAERERAEWRIGIKAEFEGYRDHPDLSTWDRSQTLNSRLTLRPTPRWTFDFSDIFVRSKDPIEEVALGLLLRKTDFWSNSLSLKGAYRLTPRLTAELEGVNRATQFKDPFLIDYGADEIKASAVYLLTPLDKVAPQYSYRNFYFERRGHTEAHAFALKWERRWTQTNVFRGMAGGLVVVDRGTTKNDYLLGLGIDHVYKPSLTLRFDFTRDVAVVGGLSGAFATNIFSGAVTLRMTEAFVSLFSASWSIQQALLASRSDLDTYAFKAEEQYAFTSWLKGFLSYAFTRQNFNESGPRDI